MVVRKVKKHLGLERFPKKNKEIRKPEGTRKSKEKKKKSQTKIPKKNKKKVTSSKGRVQSMNY